MLRRVRAEDHLGPYSGGRGAAAGSERGHRGADGRRRGRAGGRDAAARARVRGPRDIGSPRAGRLRIPAAPEVEDDAVTAALRATSWNIFNVDQAEWLTATWWAAELFVAEAYQADRELLDHDAARISPDVVSRLDAGRRVAPASCPSRRCTPGPGGAPN